MWQLNLYTKFKILGKDASIMLAGIQLIYIYLKGENMSNLFMRFPKGRSKTLTLSYDDGVEQDIRLIEIMNKYGLKGTFNLNTGNYAKENKKYEDDEIHRVMTKKQATEVYSDCGQEIAVHSLTHPFLEQLPSSRVAYEISRDRENLENQFGIIVRGMAYPYGTYNDEVIDILKKLNIAYARTVISTEDFRIPTDWLRLTTTCHHNNPKLMELSEKFLTYKPKKEPALFYLWGHSYEFEKDNNWHIIENFSRYMGNKDDIWYATNIEIYEYIEAFKKLIFSMDGNIVENPTAITLYFVYKNRDYVIKSGEVLKLF